MNGDPISQTLAVSFDYPVIFTERVFAPGNKTLMDTMGRLREDRVHRALAIVDANAVKARPALAGELIAYFAAHASHIELVASPLVVPGGEGIKNDLSFIRQVVSSILDAHLCRHSFVIAVGGGAVLDAAGFAASLVHRGLRLVRLPTTVLGQSDSGIGVKNGVNLRGVKNAIGTFSPPFAVINDERLLLSLPDREWIGGMSEAFKVAIIRDRVFFDFLADHATELRGRDADAMRHLVRRCAALHLDHTRSGGDPFESSRARPLDFGHWSAHKLESMSGFAIPHGEAVGVGVLLDCSYAVIQGWLAPGQFESIRRAMAASGLPSWFDLLMRRNDSGLEIFDGLEEFREHLGGSLCITFPKGIGSSLETGSIDLEAMEAALLQLRMESTGAISAASGRDQR